MRKRSAKMIKSEQALRTIFVKYNIQPDRWGNYKIKTTEYAEPVTYRFKFKSNILRVETQRHSSIWFLHNSYQILNADTHSLIEQLIIRLTRTV